MIKQRSQDCRPLWIVRIFIVKYNLNVYELVKFILPTVHRKYCIMGIHYDYKSTRGAKKMQKQQEREQRRRKKKQSQATDKPKHTVPEDVVLTLDMITDPNR